MQNINLHEELQEEYDDVAPHVGEYGDAEYWDRNFAADLHPVEWYDDYSAFRDIIDPHLDEHFRYLEEVPEDEDLYEDDIAFRNEQEMVWNYKRQVLVAGVGNSCLFSVFFFLFCMFL